MNTRVAGILAALILVASAAVTARADDEAVRKEIQALYDHWLDGWKSKDITAIMSPLVPDFVYTNSNGKVRNRKQIESDWKDALKLYKSIERLSLSAGEVTLHGNEASDVSTWKFSGVYTDPQGKDRPATELFTSRDTLVRTPNGWMFKRSKDLKVVVTVDGKPVADPYDPFGTEKKTRKK
jgi:ketosteroid isomerase-like protein